MKTKVIFTAYVALILLSCNQKKELQDILPVGCYWDILDIGSPHPINSCYKFGKTGDCGFYYYNFFNKIRTDSVFLFDDGDVIVRNKWEMLKDSVQIRANKYYVIRYNTDSVFLTATGNDTMILIRNCRTFKQMSKL